MAREKRAKNKCKELLAELKEKNLINEELADKLSIYHGVYFVFTPHKENMFLRVFFLRYLRHVRKGYRVVCVAAFHAKRPIHVWTVLFVKSLTIKDDTTPKYFKSS